MKKPSIFEGVCLAIGLALQTAIVLIAGRVLNINQAILLKLLFTILSITYLAYIALRARNKNGRLTLGTLALITISISNILQTSPLSHLSCCLAHLSCCLALTWMLRSLLNYRSFLSSGIDFILLALGTLAAFGSYSIGGGLISNTWIFFLIQGLHTLIPTSFRKSYLGDLLEFESSQDNFARNNKIAERALQHLVYGNIRRFY